MNLEENYTTSEDKKFFFDTYAFMEILEGSKNYQNYITSDIITSKLNIFELYLMVMRNVDEKKAEELIDKYYKFVEDFDEDVIIVAAKMKKELNKRELSMTDCIGYMMAKQFGVKFLTGDKEFEGMDNVEFVK